MGTSTSKEAGIIPNRILTLRREQHNCIGSADTGESVDEWVQYVAAHMGQDR